MVIEVGQIDQKAVIHIYQEEGRRIRKFQLMWLPGTKCRTSPSDIKSSYSQKSPALGSLLQIWVGSKGGNKKIGKLKDPKKGNILSFFRKV
ncbi:hypothetical protein SLA2020_158850 [Shorea laevis]